jgi:trk system potassium uptake protein TrkA
MKIVIAGGDSKADFIIKMLRDDRHKVVAINEEKSYCEYLATVHNIPIIHGDPCKKYILDNADIKDFDVMIALKESDADNLEICQMAQKVYNIKKTVCVVSNPHNVEIFKALGVNSPISATYIVANLIEQASTLDVFMKSLELEEDKVIVTEIIVEPDFPVVDKKIMDMELPKNVIIGSIIREGKMIIPNGSTEILSEDKLIIISSKEDQLKAVDAIGGR